MIRCFLKFLLIAAIASASHAAPGDVDASFGTGGYWSPPAECCGPSWGRAIAIQPDGKVVVAGHVYNGKVNQNGVVRFNADGTRDTSFGDSGLALLPVGTSSSDARDVALLPDGRIVVLGNYLENHPFLVRLTTSGQLDTTFGTGGIRSVPVLVSGSNSAMVAQGCIN